MTADQVHGLGEVVGDRAAVLGFFRANVVDLHRYVSRLTGGDRPRTEDLVQEVFVRLARAAAEGKPVPAHPGWLTTTARHVFLHDDRHAQRDHRRVVRAGSWRGAVEPGIEGVADALPLREAVGRLSDQERAALVFRYVDDLPVAEVAALLGRSVEATESLLVRARRRLRRELGEEA